MIYVTFCDTITGINEQNYAFNNKKERKMGNEQEYITLRDGNPVQLFTAIDAFLNVCIVQNLYDENTVTFLRKEIPELLKSDRNTYQMAEDICEKLREINNEIDVEKMRLHTVLSSFYTHIPQLIQLQKDVLGNKTIPSKLNKFLKEEIAPKIVEKYWEAIYFQRLGKILTVRISPKSFATVYPDAKTVEQIRNCLVNDFTIWLKYHIVREVDMVYRDENLYIIFSLILKIPPNF